jgi:hypothetical protein
MDLIIVQMKTIPKTELDLEMKLQVPMHQEVQNQCLEVDQPALATKMQEM